MPHVATMDGICSDMTCLARVLIRSHGVVGFGWGTLPGSNMGMWMAWPRKEDHEILYQRVFFTPVPCKFHGWEGHHPSRTTHWGIGCLFCEDSACTFRNTSSVDALQRGAASTFVCFRAVVFLRT